MIATFRIVSGARAGAAFTPEGREFTAGRAPDAALRFDASADLAVSARHAQFRLRGGEWTVRDLGSSNGTFVNGGAIQSEAVLRHGDRVGFGMDGPVVECHFVAHGAVDGSAYGAAYGAAYGSAPKRARARMRTVIPVVLLSAMAVTVVAAIVGNGSRSRAAFLRERAELEARVDSLLQQGRATEASLQVEVAGLDGALRQSEERLQSLRTELAAPGAGRAGNDELMRREVLALSAALRRQQMAASLDFAAIQQRARGAVAMVWVEYRNGERVTGTAFAVRADGTMLTSRHLLHGSDGSRRPGRIAVRFADSDQAFPARVLDVAADWDLAAIRAENIAGGLPTVASLNQRDDTVALGAPVALIGFPLGGEPEHDPLVTQRVSRPVVSAALMLRRHGEGVEVQGLGAEGASGSPILDGSGEVIAILYGGRTENGVQILLGVPSAAAAGFLSGVK